MFWSFTVWISCSSDLKNFANSWLSASDFKSFSRSPEQFFLTVGQNNFGKKIPLFFQRPKVSLNQKCTEIVLQVVLWQIYSNRLCPSTKCIFHEFLKCRLWTLIREIIPLRSTINICKLQLWKMNKKSISCTVVLFLQIKKGSK